MDRTLTIDERDERDERTRAGAPALCRVLACDALSTPPSWLGLGDVDEVHVGRADAPGVLRTGRVIEIALADHRVSRPHVTLRVSGNTVHLEDQGSKNGTVVDGEHASNKRLADGAVIEVGRTFFVVRLGAADTSQLPLHVVTDGLPPLSTASPAFAAVLSTLLRVAPSTSSVLLHGETGTGKEVLAKQVHARSGRKGAFVAVNCGALPSELVEAELFGAKKGAFSGATADRPGYVRAAEGGTLFLDEIGDLPLSAQPALLRVLQEREVTPVGAVQPQKVDFRLVCATHRDLAAEVVAGRFRADLHARLAGVTLRLPPLRERREDLGTLVATFLSRASRPVQLTARAARALMLSRYDGNVRALERALEAALALAGAAAADGVGDAPVVIDVEHVQALADDTVIVSPVRLEGAAARTAPSEPRDEVESELRALLTTHKGNVSAVAREMGKARMQVYRWLERYGLDPRTFQ